jgi:glutaredoxin
MSVVAIDSSARFFYRPQKCTKKRDKNLLFTASFDSITAEVEKPEQEANS